MEFIRLENSNSQEFKEAWNIYESSFPLDERRTLKLQKELIKNNNYNFFIVIKDGILVAIFADWKFEDFLFVEHFAVREDLRRRGIGTELLKTHISKNKQKIVLEVEKPENEIKTKTIKFYEKMGFKLNNFDYIQPPYIKDKNSVPMLIMTYPEKIDESEFSSIRQLVHIKVYGLDKPYLHD